MVEDGLVHRFVTIIGHHPPDGRSYASGIVSPVKKRGSPPPNGRVIRVGAFDEHIRYRHVTDSVWIYLESKPMGGTANLHKTSDIPRFNLWETTILLTSGLSVV